MGITDLEVYGQVLQIIIDWHVFHDLWLYALTNISETVKKKKSGLYFNFDT